MTGAKKSDVPLANEIAPSGIFEKRRHTGHVLLCQASQLAKATNPRDDGNAAKHAHDDSARQVPRRDEGYKSNKVGGSS